MNLTLGHICISLFLWSIVIKQDLINETIDLINEAIDHDHNNRL